jgi:ParB-like chromosome segregation protein Spo0J
VRRPEIKDRGRPTRSSAGRFDRLIPYAKNARTHTDAQVAAIAASIKEWGWTTPALVGEDGGLIAGHARVLAARQLGIAKIPVMVAAGWSEAQKRAYVLADNQLAITGSGWDPELLRLELGELKLSGFDLSHLAAVSKLDPDFAEKFLAFVIREVIRAALPLRRSQLGDPNPRNVLHP